MLGTLFKQQTQSFSSSLYDEHTFYDRFLQDVLCAKKEVIIESPFITTRRMKQLYPLLEQCIHSGISITIITRSPKNQGELLEGQAECEIQLLEQLGVQVFLCEGNHHRKVAIIDRRVLWEGSLNILSQTRSREIMRRISGEAYAQEMFQFLNLDTIR